MFFFFFCLPNLFFLFFFFSVRANVCRHQRSPTRQGSGLSGHPPWRRQRPENASSAQPASGRCGVEDAGVRGGALARDGARDCSVLGGTREPCVALRCVERPELRCCRWLLVACRREGEGGTARSCASSRTRRREDRRRGLRRAEEPEEGRGGQRKQKAEGREVEVEGDTYWPTTDNRGTEHRAHERVKEHPPLDSTTD